MTKKCKPPYIILSLVYILSHPFLNRLISFHYNFYDEELIDIYIAFLKSLALQINSDTIRFFYNSVILP